MKLFLVTLSLWVLIPSLSQAQEKSAAKQSGQPAAQASGDSLSTIKDCADVVQSILTSLGILIGGGWAWWRFGRERGDAWNLQLTVNPEVVDYAPNQKLLIVNVLLKNIGKVAIHPAEQGCLVSLYQLQDSAAVGSSPGITGAICENLDLLAAYDKHLYWIEPGAEYRELEYFVVTVGDVLLVKAAFWSEEDAVADYRVIRVS